MDTKAIAEFIGKVWSYEQGQTGAAVRALQEYIKIPNDSPGFDPDWAEHGYMDQAVDMLLEAVDGLARDWESCFSSDIRHEVLGGKEAPLMNDKGKRRTPLVLIEIPAFGGYQGQDSILLYGHLDKQPGLEGQWSEGLGPRIPVIRDGKLYGRGGADDGYAIFSAFSAVMALRAQKLPHARCVIMIEACEESGSSDLEFYVNNYQEKLGDISLIVCLDSGCENYEQLWMTTSLRGVARGILNIGVSREGVHSGDASGIVPSPFRIARQLLARLEDERSGEITPAGLKVDIPDYIKEQAQATAATLGKEVYGKYPFLEGVQPVEGDLTELVLNRTWKSGLAVIGLDGIPPVQSSGNVMLPDLRLALSLRLPPSLDCTKAAAVMKEVLEKDPPYNAKISFEVEEGGNGWAAPELQPWLEQAITQASENFFGKEALGMGEGGSIPIMNMLAQRFPKAQFLICGVNGPGSNAHGPDEFLHLPMTAKLSMCVAWVLGKQGAQA